ncbi:MAG TPA: hypothetical protein VKA97_06230 [Pyrinomonadaceae bacterium]|nr:hypothetical protein [Pyrinomonadaceae bacterium]
MTQLLLAGASHDGHYFISTEVTRFVANSLYSNSIFEGLSCGAGS